MRIEPLAFVFRAEDRRQRSQDKRERSERRGQQASCDRRARHAAHPWLSASFGAHLLGQVAPHWFAPAEEIKRAYKQPEARMPVRPRLTAEA